MKNSKKAIATTMVALGLLGGLVANQSVNNSEYVNMHNVGVTDASTSGVIMFDEPATRVEEPKTIASPDLRPFDYIEGRAFKTSYDRIMEVINHIREERLKAQQELEREEQNNPQGTVEPSTPSETTPSITEPPVVEPSEPSQIVEPSEPIEESKGITPDNMFLTVGKNTSDDVIERNKIMVNSDNGFTLSQDTIDNIMKTIKGVNKPVSFYITDPETMTTISYNAQDKIFPASAIKAGMALLACKMVDAGLLDMDMELEYKASQSCGGSGSIQYDPVGTKYTLREVVHRTIHISDNIGYYMLQDLVTKEKYDEMVSELGCTNQIGKWAKWGYMSAQDLNLVWQEIYNSDRLEGEEMYHKANNGEAIDESRYSACAILNYELLTAKYNFLENAFPYDCSHKSGFNPKSYNDSGVVYTPHGNYIVSIMTQASNSGNERAFKQIGGALNGALTELGNYKEAVASNTAEADTTAEMGE
mgnify:CR=1 FL=1